MCGLDQGIESLSALCQQTSTILYLCFSSYFLECLQHLATLLGEKLGLFVVFFNIFISLSRLLICTSFMIFIILCDDCSVSNWRAVAASFFLKLLLSASANLRYTCSNALIWLVVELDAMVQQANAWTGCNDNARCHCAKMLQQKIFKSNPLHKVKLGIAIPKFLNS